MSALVSQAEMWRAVDVPAACSRASRLLAVGAGTVMVAAPLAFGATSTLASVLLVTASWLLFLFWIGERIRAGRLRAFAHPLALPSALLLGFTALHWAAGLSAAPVETELEWLRWVGYLSLAVVAASSIDTPERLRGLASGIAASGFAIAVFGIAQHLSSGGKLYWVWQLENGGQFFGPYVNRNHFAGLMELWCPLALGMALLPQNSQPRRWFWSVLGVVMFGAVVLSGSRGGTVSISVAVLVFALLTTAQRGGRRAAMILLIAMLLAGATALALGQGPLLERYQASLKPHAVQQEETAAHRLAAWGASLELMRRHWLLGNGLDTFGTLSPGVRSFATDKIWSHAHNDFLQFLAETGLIGGALGLWLFYAGGVEAARNLRRMSGTATGILLVALASGCCGFLVHGWLDFNFHIPANASNFAVLAAVLTHRSWNEG